VQEHERIENIFRYSSSSEELFDAFQEALRHRIKSLDSFKILLANPSLNPDEIKMFTEKLITDIPQKAYDINLWTAKIFENYLTEYDRLEDCINYYQRAHLHQPTLHEPLLKLLNLYNYDLDYPSNRKILNLIEDCVASVKYKSKVYYALANHYRRIGDNRMEVKCLSLAEKEAGNEKI
jgi:tetratricopeptide (TPR) repeat protein